MGFVKIHDAIFSSSIVEEDLVVRWVWICFLAACDKNGNVHGTEPALARKANVSIKDFQKAVEVLTRPDSTSTTPDHGGRRLVKLTGNLWFCVNYLFYRNMKDPIEEREKAKLRQRKSRALRKGDVTAVTNPSRPVTESNDKAEAYAEAKESPSDSLARVKGKYPEEFEQFWAAYPKKKSKADALKAWKQVTKDRPPTNELLSKLDGLMSSNEWQKDGGQYIPYPASWLRAGGWDDEVKTTTKQGGNRGKGKSEYDSVL